MLRVIKPEKALRT